MQSNNNKQNNIAALIIIVGAVFIFGFFVLSTYISNDFYREPSDSGLIDLPQITVSVGYLTVTVDLHVESEDSQNTAALTERITRELQAMSAAQITDKGSVSSIRNNLMTSLNNEGYNISNIFVSDLSHSS